MYELLIESDKENVWNQPDTWLNLLRNVDNFSLQGNSDGVYIGQVLRPEHNPQNDLIVKVINDSIPAPYLEQRKRVFSNPEVETYLGEDYLKIIKQFSEGNISYLSRLLVLEHRLHEIAFPGFTLPAKFGRLKIPHDITSEPIDIPQRLNWLKKNGAALTEDNRQLLIKSNEEKDVMVVPFLGHRKSVFAMGGKPLPIEIKNQMDQFLYQIEDLYHQTGLIPDKKMFHPNEDHLIVINGKLLLLDTNNLVFDPDDNLYSGFRHEFLEMMHQSSFE